MGAKKFRLKSFLKNVYEDLEDYFEDRMQFGLIIVITIVALLVYWCCKRHKEKQRHRHRQRQQTVTGTRPSAPPDEDGGDYQRLYPDLGQAQSNSVLGMYSASDISCIQDRFSSLGDVSEAIRIAGLESSNLIFGIDYTTSNATNGQWSFHGNSLHTIAPDHFLNPYQEVISILGETLSPFDDDGIIPAFGFGDVTTGDKRVFPLKPQGYCNGFNDVLQTYNDITPRVRLSGPTSFAPLIYQAIDIVKQTKSYHILVIVADGQVTSEKPTRQAIIEASSWPLSIILVGVGDGPWHTMKHYDDNLTNRHFDNFQFVDFHSIVANAKNRDSTFALHALMEIPDQFKEIRRLGLLDMA